MAKVVPVLDPPTLCPDTGPWFSLLNLFALFPHWACGETIQAGPALRSLNPVCHLLQHQLLPDTSWSLYLRSNKSLALYMLR